MKKCFLLAAFAAGTLGAMAQVDVEARTNTNNGTTVTLLSTGDYSAYAAPSNVQMYFTRDYPTVSTNVNWMPVGEWWRATYNDKGFYTHTFYTTAGEHFLINLPKTTTWVPEDVVMAASNMHPGSLYDITTLKAWDGSEVYAVRHLEDGEIKTHFVDASGNTVEYYRTEEMDKKMKHHKMEHHDKMMMHDKDKMKHEKNEMKHEHHGVDADNIKEMKIKSDEDGTKVKIETKDGKEIKKKYDKDGNVKTKVDNL